MDAMAASQPRFKKELVIPQEILELVVENLGDDEVSLSAFSLVSRIFLSACRVHRFRHLTFANPLAEDRFHAYKQCLALRKLATEAPDLLRHTRRLTLILERPLGNDPSLPWIIERLRCLSSLRLLSGSVEPVIEWDSFSPELQQALQVLFRRSPTIHSLVIRSYENVPVEILRGATSLKHMAFNYTSWSPDPSISPNFASEDLARPTSLRVAGYARNGERRTEMFMEPPKSLFSVEALVELEVVWTERMGLQFESIFGPCLRSLQSLSVEFVAGAHESVPVNLSRLSSLRVWKATVSFSRLAAFFRSLLRRRAGTPEGSAFDEYNTMIASLKTVEPNFSKLELFYLKVTADNSVDTIHWGELDDMIARLNRAHPLQTVTIDFHCPPTYPSGSQTGPTIRTHLPLVDALGILVVQTRFD
ncbi:hypothetical protein BDN72DRAFT_894132 [Pluteus cervinus]|uniref:Uncharacterized protein n=1 Tax=Pluteus cervinus TaxID=181527 RepID=A0ACD3B6J1_9AGAR|nr:hypothetical protein BDN72DRAFT_894132 [Pluteus cervinus]